MTRGPIPRKDVVDFWAPAGFTGAGAPNGNDAMRLLQGKFLEINSGKVA